MRTIVCLLFIGFLLVACKNNSAKDLAKIEKQELAKGIRQDSVFMGIHLGMAQQDFYNYCWAMNKKGVFFEGYNKSVEYQIGKITSNFPVQLNFFPQFKDGKIAEIPFLFTYKTLDPWNPNMQTDKLVAEVKTLMEKWYGKDFFIAILPTGEKVYAKVDGNRRVIIKVVKDFEVTVMVTDLSVI
ncbi:MAG: hypothetical protein JNL70_05195 [Saprospiraceae bacterium]|nr:hypothetical protein [Saprospiraceae bacterium]